MVRVIKYLIIYSILSSCQHSDQLNLEQIIENEIIQVKQKRVFKEYLETIFKTDQNNKLKNNFVPETLNLEFKENSYKELKNHTANIERVKQIYKAIGYPRVKDYGEIAESVFWAVPQHDRKVENTKYFLPIMKLEFDKGNLQSDLYLWYLRRRLVHLSDTTKFGKAKNEKLEILNIENYLFDKLEHNESKND